MLIIIDMTEPDCLKIVEDGCGYTKYFDGLREATEFAEREVVGDYQIVEVDI